MDGWVDGCVVGGWWMDEWMDTLMASKLINLSFTSFSLIWLWKEPYCEQAVQNMCNLLG